MVTQSVSKIFKISPRLTRRKRTRRNSLTIRYLERRLKRLDWRIAHGKAKETDYAQRERVAAQLEDAKKFL